MHAYEKYAENSEQQNKRSHTHIRTRYALGNPFGRRPHWKVRLLCSLSMYGNMVVSTKKYGL